LIRCELVRGRVIRQLPHIVVAIPQRLPSDLMNRLWRPPAAIAVTPLEST
jgi:hypothetical protein